MLIFVDPLSYKVLRKRYKNFFDFKKILYTVNSKIIRLMQKNSPENFSPLEVDNITGEFYVKIPEWVINDMNWYEDTEVHFKVDGKEVIITEKD